MRYRLFWPWVLLGTVCSVLMWLLPGEETVPYHVAWIGIATAYGLETWPRFRTVFSIATFTVVTGAILVVRAATGVIAWQETAEIPLMSILMLLMVWHVLRRQLALSALTDMVDRERRRATQRERLSRMTSHEMRTPATIAMGYVDLLLVQEEDADRRADLEVVVDELERLILASDRLVRMLWIPDQDGLQDVDLDALLTETAERWSVLADRDWKVTSSAGVQKCSLDRVRACLDTLVENAVRYTNEGDVVRLISFERGGNLMVGVADSGPGLEPGVAASINEMREDASVAATLTVADPKAQTGLGLGLVREAVAARGGKILAGRSDEGGASVLMILPTGEGEKVSDEWANNHQAPPRPSSTAPSLHLDGTYR